MKLAICLQGLSSGKSDSNYDVTFNKAYDYLKRNIIECNYLTKLNTPTQYDVDVFIHTWNTDKDDINTIKLKYNPVASVFEKQILFDKNNKKRNVIKSRWYSHMKSVNLAKENEILNDFKYDFILVTRFDNVFFTPFEFESYDRNAFYSSNWSKPHSDEGFLDYWFLAGSDIMDKFSNLYENIDKYLDKEEVFLSNHVLSKHHANNLKLEQKFIKHEWDDFTLERRLT